MKKGLGIGAAAVVGFIVLIAIISSVGKGGTATTSPAGSAVTSSSSPASVASQAAAKPQEFSGTGPKAVPLTLVKGLMDAKMKGTGSSNFAVTVLGPSGQPVALLANVIGNFTGEQATHINADGKYALNVEANGPWTIQVVNIASLTSAGAPQPAAGTGPAVVAFSLKVGLTTAEMKHSGKSNFAVMLLNADGTPADLMANVIGQFDGSKATGIRRAGVYIFNIEADGAWNLDVR